MERRREGGRYFFNTVLLSETKQCAIKKKHQDSLSSIGQSSSCTKHHPFLKEHLQCRGSIEIMSGDKTDGGYA